MSSSTSAAGRAATCTPSQPSGTRSWGSRARPGWWRSRVPESDCTVLHQDFLDLDLPPARFRRDLRQRLALPRAEQSDRARARRARRGAETHGRALLLEPARRQPGRLGRRALRLLLRPGDLARPRSPARASSSFITTTGRPAAPAKSSRGSPRSGASATNAGSTGPVRAAAPRWPEGVARLYNGAED